MIGAMPASTPALGFAQVTKSYGNRRVLDAITLDVAHGEFFGLAGINGAGKTTLLKCLLDFCAFDAGTIAIHGTPHTLPHARRPLAYLPERFAPPHYLTGRGFLDFSARLDGVTVAESALQTMLGLVELDADALKKPVRSFSKGMNQKLGLIACFLSGKPLLVLDEPTTGLDPKARLLLRRYLATWREAGRTVFMSSHALNDLEMLCDRVAILHNSRLRFVGSPQQCREQFGANDLENAYLKAIEAS